jgi:hypothetical protein
MVVVRIDKRMDYLLASLSPSAQVPYRRSII